MKTMKYILIPRVRIAQDENAINSSLFLLNLTQFKISDEKEKDFPSYLLFPARKQIEDE